MPSISPDEFWTLVVLTFKVVMVREDGSGLRSVSEWVTPHKHVFDPTPAGIAAQSDVVSGPPRDQGVVRSSGPGPEATGRMCSMEADWGPSPPWWPSERRWPPVPPEPHLRTRHSSSSAVADSRDGGRPTPSIPMHDEDAIREAIDNRANDNIARVRAILCNEVDVLKALAQTVLTEGTATIEEGDGHLFLRLDRRNRCLLTAEVRGDGAARGGRTTAPLDNEAALRDLIAYKAADGMGFLRWRT
jgi:hypothetical protein